MGSQQLLLTVLGLVIIAIAIAVGILLFSSSSVQSNKDGLINDMNNLASNGIQYRMRLRSMGGGGNSFTGYTIPQKLRTNDNGSFVVVSTSVATFSLQATSSLGYGTISATIDTVGKMSGFTYSGEF